MKSILLLGATGKTGKEVMNYALSKGYHITALVRDPGKADANPGRITLVKGTPVNASDVRAIKGYEAVISTLGHSNLDPSPLMTDSIKNMVMAMREKGIRRIVVQTGAGAGDSFSRMPLPDEPQSSRVLNPLTPAPVLCGLHIRPLDQYPGLTFEPIMAFC